MPMSGRALPIPPMRMCVCVHDRQCASSQPKAPKPHATRMIIWRAHIP